MIEATAQKDPIATFTATMANAEPLATRAGESHTAIRGALARLS